MARTVLHVLSQRPSLTGSGVTLDAFVRRAASRWRQHVVVGVPAADPHPAVGGLPAAQIHPLVFETDALPFPLPGMSDVMPYRSSRWSALTDAQLAAYREAWRRHLGRVLAEVAPDVIHVHHVWLVAALLRELAPALPIVNQCHATGLRQAVLCPHLAAEVRAGCAGNDRFLVLHHAHSAALTDALGVPPDRVHVVGAGYRDEVFHPRGRAAGDGGQLVYVGKYSAAKGLPWLLDAMDRLRASHPDLCLHVAGSGAGDEAEGLRARMARMAPRVVLHGQLDQRALADVMRRAAVCVLPSFYEGVPLVLVEALACGCRLVSTRLPGVVDQLAPHLGDALTLVDPPRLVGVDTPEPAALPGFVDRLAEALAGALAAPPVQPSPAQLAPFTWAAVFERVERVWGEAIAGRG